MEQKQYKGKRRKMASLMSEDEKQKGNIQDLSYDFACRMVRLYQYLTEDSEYKEYVMSNCIEAGQVWGRM